MAKRLTTAEIEELIDGLGDTDDEAVTAVKSCGDPDLIRFVGDREGAGRDARPIDEYPAILRALADARTPTEPTALILAALSLGGNAADAYFNEFERSPADDGAEAVGDWDSSAWECHQKELRDAGMTEENYGACLEAWREGFWGWKGSVSR